MARKQNDDLLIEDELAAAFLNDDSMDLAEPVATPQAAATTPTAPSTQPAPAVIDPDTLTFASVKQARAVVISKDITAVDGQLVFTLRIALPEGKQGGTYAYTVTKSQYDSYESGSLIDLQYRVDQDGRIAIVR